MAFSTNYNDVFEGGELPEGTYEMLFTKSSEEMDNKQRPRLNFQFVVRNDVQQPCQGWTFFHSIYKSREPKPLDANTNGYSFASLMQIAAAAGLAEGKNYAGLAEFISEFTNRPIKVTVKHDEYNGKKSARVKYWNKTDAPIVNHRAKAAPSQPQMQMPSQKSGNVAMPWN